MSVIRVLDYYDLIELPSGRHIPVPLAIKAVGLEEVLKIPIAEKKRDGKFYFCEVCREYYCDYCEWFDSGISLEELKEKCKNCCAGYSFFRCKRHKPLGKYESDAKLAVFEAMIKAGMHEFLKYIEVSDTWRAISKGRIEIRTVRVVESYGKMSPF